MKKIIILLIALVVLVGGGIAVYFLASESLPEADLRFISGDTLHDFDPQKSSWMVDFRILQAMWEGLTRMQPEQGKPGEGVAKSWSSEWRDVDGEQLYVWTFKLRDDAKWSNGDPVVANDFIYGWRRALLPDMSSDYVEMIWTIHGAREWWELRNEGLKAYAESEEKSAEKAQALYDQHMKAFDEMVGVKAIDDHTLEVYLDHPIPYFLELMAFATFSPIHEGSISQYVSAPDADTGMVQFDPQWMSPDAVVTNGPYVLEWRRAARDLYLSANPHYWNRQAMKNQSIYMKIFTEPQTAKRAYETGQYDWWPDVPTGTSMAEDLQAASRRGERKDVHAYTAAGTYFMIFNCNANLPDGRENPFADARVRRAFALAVNRKELIEKVIRAGQLPAHTFVPPIFDGFQPEDYTGHTFDLDTARQLLTEAGYENGEGLEDIAILLNPNVGHETVAEFLIEQWRTNLGVNVTIDSLPSKRFGEARKKQEFEIARGNWFGDYQDPTTFLKMYLSDGGNNDAKWKNPEYDALLAKAETEEDAKARLALLAEAERLLMEEAPITPLYFYIHMDMFDPARVKGLHLTPFRFQQLEMIEVEPRK